VLLIISLVIPVYNEEKIIKDTIESVKIFMDKTFDADYEAIFVDDGSRDNSLKIADSLACANIKIISHKKNRGKGGAVRTGILAASGEFIFFTDCYLAYGLDVIRTGHAILENNKKIDILIGSRRKHKEGYASYSFLRKFISLSYFAVLRAYGGLKHTTDSQSGIKGFRSKAAKQLFKLCETDSMAFDLEILLLADKLGFKIEEMPVKIINHEDSKVNIIRDSIRMLKDISKIKKSIKKRF